MSRFAIFGAQDPNAIMPRLDPVSRERRIDPHAPVVEAYLGGRPVVLARMDPLTRRPGDPSDLTVPLTMSRYQHALDIERDYRPSTWEPTPLVGMGDNKGETVMWLAAGAVVGAGMGAVGGAALGGLYGAFTDSPGRKAVRWAGTGALLGPFALLALANLAVLAHRAKS